MSRDKLCFSAICFEVKREKPGLFNALNLATLEHGRPAALEAPAACAHFETGVDYFTGWREWCARWALRWRERDSGDGCRLYRVRNSAFVDVVKAHQM